MVCCSQPANFEQPLLLWKATTCLEQPLVFNLGSFGRHLAIDHVGLLRLQISKRIFACGMALSYRMLQLALSSSTGGVLSPLSLSTMILSRKPPQTPTPYILHPTPLLRVIAIALA